MNIKPGDLFRFVYLTDNDDVKSDEIFSGQMNRWISCDRMCLCIGLDKKNIYWIDSDNKICCIRSFGIEDPYKPRIWVTRWSGRGVKLNKL